MPSLQDSSSAPDQRRAKKSRLQQIVAPSGRAAITRCRSSTIESGLEGEVLGGEVVEPLLEGFDLHFQVLRLVPQSGGDGFGTCGTEKTHSNTDRSRVKERDSAVSVEPRQVCGLICRPEIVGLGTLSPPSRC